MELSLSCSQENFFFSHSPFLSSCTQQVQLNLKIKPELSKARSVSHRSSWAAHSWKNNMGGDGRAAVGSSSLTHLSWPCTQRSSSAPQLLQNWTWCAKHNPFQTEPEFCFERVVKFTRKLNFVLPDLIQNPNGAKKSLHTSWNQRILVKDAQGQTILKTVSSNFKHWSVVPMNGVWWAEAPTHPLEPS